MKRKIFLTMAMAFVSLIGAAGSKLSSDVDKEKSLQIESWMLDSDYWVNDTLKNEGSYHRFNKFEGRKDYNFGDFNGKFEGKKYGGMKHDKFVDFNGKFEGKKYGGGMMKGVMPAHDKFVDFNGKFEGKNYGDMKHDEICKNKCHKVKFDGRKQKEFKGRKFPSRKEK